MCKLFFAHHLSGFLCLLISTFSPLNCSAFWFVLVGLPRQHLPLYLYLGFMK